MRRKSRDLISRFSFDKCWEGILFGICRACEREILPHKNAQLITEFVPRLRFVSTTAPHTQHDQVCFACLQQSLASIRFIRSKESFWNPIRTSAPNRLIIHSYCKSCAVNFWSRIKRNATQSNSSRPTGNLGTLLCQFNSQAMDVLRAISAWPPTHRPRHNDDSVSDDRKISCASLESHHGIEGATIRRFDFNSRFISCWITIAYCIDKDIQNRFILRA